MNPKPAVVAAFTGALRDEIHRLGAVTAMARDEATSEEARPENEYDTRALEASYLAAGQGQRLEDVRGLLAWVQQLDAARRLRVIEPGALAVVEDEDGALRTLFVAPTGGATLGVNGQVVQVISPRSALGTALLGLGADDAGELDGPGGTKELRVVEVW